MKRVSVIIEIIILINSGGCEKSKGEALTGRWELLEAGQSSGYIDNRTFDFFEDGIVRVLEIGDTISDGEYELTGGNKIKISHPRFETLSGTISTSKDEMSLAGPSEKVEKYGKVERIEKITESAVAGNYVRVMRTPEGEEEYGLPDITTWTEDGTEKENLLGQWKAHEELQLDSYEFYVGSLRSMSINAGQIRADMLYREPPTPSLIKKSGAKVIRKLEGGNILWSDYYWSSDPSNEVTFALEIKEDGTFRHIVSVKNAWRIRDGRVEIPQGNHLDNTDSLKGIDNEEELVKGEIERSGYAIVFRKDDGTELRYIRKSKQFLSKLEAPLETPSQITPQ